MGRILAVAFILPLFMVPSVARAEWPLAVPKEETKEKPIPTTAVETKTGPDRASAPPPSATGPGSAKKTRVVFSGYRYLRYRTYSSSGNRQRFLADTGLASFTGSVEQGTDLKVDANFGVSTKLEGHFLELPLQERKMDFLLTTGHFLAHFGDFGAKIENGSLGSYSRQITGVQGGYQTKRLTLTALTSKSRSSSKSETFTGRNTRGPYDLRFPDVVAESVVVKINNRTLSADEFQVDAFTGDITFKDIVSPNDFVTVTYEQKLLNGLSEGSVSGMAATYKYDKRHLEFGVSHIAQPASRNAEKTRENISGEQIALAPGARNVATAHKFIVKGSETLTLNGRPLERGVDYNLAVSPQSAALNARNIANGIFTLSAPVASASVFTVSYSYYPANLVNYYSFEDLSPDITMVVYPKHSTIYYGSESIFACADRDLTLCGPPLEPEIDYQIDESRNRIQFLPSANIAFVGRPFVRIDYNTFNPARGDTSAYDHTVTGYRFAYKPASGRYLEYELASSVSDVALKPVPVFNSRPPIPPGGVDCPSPANPQSCRIFLGAMGIVENSDRIYVNSRNLTDALLQIGRDYTVDYTTGFITLSRSFPAGTVLLADYAYFPLRNGGLKTGYASNASFGYAAKFAKFDYKTRANDSFFAPIGGENTLDTRQTDMSMDFTALKWMNLKLSSTSNDTALDLYKINTRSDRQESLAADFMLAYLKSLSLTASRRRQDDDLPSPLTKNSDASFGIKLASDIPFLKHSGLTYGLDQSKHTDDLNPAGDSKTTKNDFSAEYKPSPKLGFAYDTSINSIVSGVAAGRITSTNLSRRLNVTWLPTDMISFGVSMDSQRTTDSRPNSEPSIANNTVLRLATKPFWRLSGINISYTRQDRPSVNSASSKSSSKSFSTGVSITKSLSYQPNYTQADSSFGDSSSKDTTIMQTLEYRPPGRPYHAGVTSQNSKRSNVYASTRTTSNSSLNSFKLGYDPSPVWSAQSQVDTEKTTGGLGGYSTFQFSTGLKYAPNKKYKQTLNILHRKRSGAFKETSTTIETIAEHKISQHAIWELTLKNSNYNNAVAPDGNFGGILLTTTLRVQF